MAPSDRFVYARGNRYDLTQGADGLWRDQHGVIWALRDNIATVDKSDNCGVLLFSLPDWHIFVDLNRACGPHDYMYSSPAFQVYNTRATADRMLESHIRQSGFFGFLAKPFRILSNVFGGRYWENDSTR
jgi:hypothetical protein